MPENIDGFKKVIGVPDTDDTVSDKLKTSYKSWIWLFLACFAAAYIIPVILIFWIKTVNVDNTLLTQNTTTQYLPTSNKTMGTISGHQWVDLGLSVKWATCNVGAMTPEDYGSFFAWGETSPKSSYSWENYKFIINRKGFSKYNTVSNKGAVDNKKRLDYSDDAARVNWGGTWRLPTIAEFDELKSKCSWTWTTQNGKTGYLVASKTNGNSIFLPAAGYCCGSTLYRVRSDGYYISSLLFSSEPNFAWFLCFDYFHVCVSYRSGRYIGKSVRPVTQ